MRLPHKTSVGLCVYRQFYKSFDESQIDLAEDLCIFDALELAVRLLRQEVRMPTPRLSTWVTELLSCLVARQMQTMRSDILHTSMSRFAGLHFVTCMANLDRSLKP